MISVIIPFYNVEDYIQRCIASIQSQTYSNFECLLIDDGSSDDSYPKALEAIQDDSRFRISRQVNKGQGAARNTGLDLAEGDYLVFVDSDDILEPTFLEKMLAALLSGGADIVRCPMKRLSASGEIVYRDKVKEQAITKQDEILDYLIKNPSPCDKLYRRSIWEGIRFPEGQYYEDLATLYRLTPNVHKIVETDEVSYDYLYEREGSTMNTFSSQHLFDWKKTTKEIYEQTGGRYFDRQDVAYFLIRFMVRTGNQENYRQLISEDLLSGKEFLIALAKRKRIKRLMKILAYQVLPTKVFNWLLEKRGISIF